VSSAAPPSNTAVAAVPLSVIAAVSEEALFRRLAFGALDRLGTAVAIAGTAIAFGLVHVPLYGTAALPVDLGAGLLFSWQRWASGSWGAPAVTHVAANVLVVVR
jgi:membrane protease YdiL (CAAX protease family)